MSITATNEGVKREIIPSGNYVARCYSMVHVGTVEEDYMGESKVQNKARITWELPTEMRVFKEENGEQPMVISKEYTLSMHEKSNLRRDLESWRGKGFTEEEARNFDVTKLLGIPCMINIIHRTSKGGTEYATISTISPLPKGLTCPKQINPTFEFNFDEKFDETALDQFPDFIKDKIKSSMEYKKLMNEWVDLPESESQGTDNEPEDDLPF